MKKTFLSLFFAVAALVPNVALADSTEMFASIVFINTSRHADDVQLCEPTLGQRGPVVNFTDNRVYFGSRQYLLSAIKGFTFHMEVVSGVRDIRPDEADQPFPVYSVDGRLVRANALSLQGLPKGIYIVKGKKHIVK